MFITVKALIDRVQWRWFIGVALILFVASVALIMATPVKAERFRNRGMYINSARGGDTTYYIISFEYTTPANVGSVRMEFCGNPIPDLPCNPPVGLNVSGAILAAQAGETGYIADVQSSNIIVLTRTPSMTGAGLSSYRFDNMRNPDGEAQDFYVRMTSHTTIDGTGAIIDYGSVTATTTPEVGIYTQVRPILIFCVAQQINDDDCSDMDGYYVDFGELESNETYYTSSEMLARTNARDGYSITVVGNTLTSGIREISALTTPTESLIGVGQFGINLTANTTPPIGTGPVGPAPNTTVSADYNIPDRFLYREGDVLVTSNDVTRTKKFTTSYILNVPEDQAPGVYSTTITYICLAGF